MKTKVIFNDTIPFSGFIAMTVWPFIFVRNKAASRYNVVANNHEHIHAEQQKEMLLVSVILAIALFPLIGLWAILMLPVFFWCYILEWLFRICQYRSTKKAYRNISFEREAYANETNLTYNATRKRFAWVRYLRSK